MNSFFAKSLFQRGKALDAAAPDAPCVMCRRISTYHLGRQNQAPCRQPVAPVTDSSQENQSLTAKGQTGCEPIAANGMPIGANSGPTSANQEPTAANRRPFRADGGRDRSGSIHDGQQHGRAPGIMKRNKNICRKIKRAGLHPAATPVRHGPADAPGFIPPPAGCRRRPAQPCRPCGAGGYGRRACGTR